MIPIRSRIVVISWWSNTLGLACLRRLTEQTHNRMIHVVQVGKSAEQRERFRQRLPTGVVELDYPEDAPAEHSRVIQQAALSRFAGETGVWFFDHDVLLQAEAESWFAAADVWFNSSPVCLCLHPSPQGLAVTQPAFWLSPARLPPDVNNFDPIPFQARSESRRPDLYRNNGELRMPVKDTLMQAADILEPRGQVGYFRLQDEPAVDSALPPFPPHTHLGGLSLFAGPVLPPTFDDWMRTTVDRFTVFFDSSADLDIEDPELLRRFNEFQEAVYDR